MYCLSVHRTVYPITINPTPSSQRLSFVLSSTVFLGQMSSSPNCPCCWSSFHRHYFSAKNFTGAVRIELTLLVSHLPGGMWLCQLRWKVCCGLDGLKLCRPSEICLEGIMCLGAASFLAFLNHSAALHVLPAPKVAFLMSLDPGFCPPTLLAAGCVPFPMSCVGRWKSLAAFVCSQTRIFPFSLPSEV